MTSPKLSFQELLAAKKAALSATTPPASGIVATALDGQMEQQAPANDFMAKIRAAKEAAATPPSTPPATPKEAPAQEADPIPKAMPKIEISSKVVEMSNRVVAAESAISEIEESSTTAEIKERIERLTTLDGFDLKQAMDGLKALILANPSACSLLLPEDVGEMVTALRRMTGNAKAELMAAPKRGGRKAAAPAKTLAPDDLDALLTDLL